MYELLSTIGQEPSFLQAGYQMMIIHAILLGRYAGAEGSVVDELKDD